MKTQTTQPLPRYSQYTVRLMAPRVWRTMASALKLWDLLSATTEFTNCSLPKPKVHRMLYDCFRPKPNVHRKCLFIHIRRRNRSRNSVDLYMTHTFTDTNRHTPFTSISHCQVDPRLNSNSWRLMKILTFFTSTNTHWWCRPNGLQRQQIEQYQQRR